MTATPNGEPKAPEENNPFIETGSAPTQAENGVESTATGESSTEPDPSKLGKPKKSASKLEWVAYAEQEGVDSSGTSKEIQARFSADAQNDSEPTSEFEDDVLAQLHGENLPISFVSGTLIGQVKVNPAGIRVLNVGLNGWIGDNGVEVVIEEAGDFEKLLSGLRDIAGQKLAQ